MEERAPPDSGGASRTLTCIAYSSQSLRISLYCFLFSFPSTPPPFARKDTFMIEEIIGTLPHWRKIDPKLMQFLFSCDDAQSLSW